MKVVALTAFLLILTTVPLRAAEPETFDPDRPFREALSRPWIESLFGLALDALYDHVEISGSLDPESFQGDREQRLRFKFYPEGKSKSDEHIAAEGWFGPSEDSRRREFHFRFSVPTSPAGLPPDRLDNVL